MFVFTSIRVVCENGKLFKGRYWRRLHDRKYNTIQKMSEKGSVDIRRLKPRGGLRLQKTIAR